MISKNRPAFKRISIGTKVRLFTSEPRCQPHNKHPMPRRLVASKFEAPDFCAMPIKISSFDASDHYL